MTNEELLQEEEIELLTLTDENGEDVEFEYLDSIDYEGRNTSSCCPPTRTVWIQI